jgi:hypothetical protein
VRVRETLRPCVPGGSIRPAARFLCSTCRRNRFFAYAVGSGEVDPVKARLRCRRSRSFLVFRIQ